MYLPVVAVAAGVVVPAAGVGAGVALGVPTGVTAGELDDAAAEGAAWCTSALHAVAAAITTASSPPPTAHPLCAVLMCADNQPGARLRDRRAPQPWRA
jgi:hypothetical protein